MQTTGLNPTELLDRAMTHLDTACEDVFSASEDMPSGSKAHQAIPQLREAMHYLRELTKALQIQAEGMRLFVAGGANTERCDRRLAELQAKNPPSPEHLAAMAPFEALRAQMMQNIRDGIAAGRPCPTCGFAELVPSAPSPVQTVEVRRRLPPEEYARHNPEQPLLTDGTHYADCNEGKGDGRTCGRPDCRYCATNVFE